MMNRALHWISVLPAACAGVLVGRLAVELLALADWSVIPSLFDRPLYFWKDFFVYLVCPACFVTLGTRVAPAQHRVVALTLAIAYFGYVFFAALTLYTLDLGPDGLNLIRAHGWIGFVALTQETFDHITVQGWIGLVVSFVSVSASVAVVFRDSKWEGAKEK